MVTNICSPSPGRTAAKKKYIGVRMMTLTPAYVASASGGGYAVFGRTVTLLWVPPPGWLKSWRPNTGTSLTSPPEPTSWRSSLRRQLQCKGDTSTLVPRPVPCRPVCQSGRPSKTSPQNAGRRGSERRWAQLFPLTPSACGEGPGCSVVLLPPLTQPSPKPPPLSPGGGPAPGLTPPPLLSVLWLLLFALETSLSLYLLETIVQVLDGLHRRWDSGLESSRRFGAARFFIHVSSFHFKTQCPHH